MTGKRPADTSRRDPPDWVDALLLRDAAQESGNYIADAGFTARVMRELPAVRALPAWRKPVVALLWLIAAALSATALPGVVVDVARTAYRVFAALPFSLSSLAFVIVALGVATWTAAAFALKRA